MVAAGHHFFGEDLVEGYAGGDDGEVFVVEAVGEDDEAESYGLLGDGGDVTPGDGVEAVDELAVAGGVDAGEVVDEVVEGIDGDGVVVAEAGFDEGVEFFGCYGCGCCGEAAVAVVFAVDADDVELVGEDLDFAFEVGGGESAFAEGAGEGVGGGDEFDTGFCEFAHEAGHEDGVAGVVEFEFVDADEFVGGEGFYGFAEGEGADEVGVFDEGAEGFGALDGVPEGGEEVGFADAESAVEVEAGFGGVFLFVATEEFAEEAAAAGGAAVDGVAEGAEGVDGLLLGGLVGVGAVGVEGDFAEAF